MMVCIEGIDASGKATQSKILARRMNAALYSFPNYETPMGKIISEHLQRKWEAIDRDPNVYTMTESRKAAQIRDAQVLQACMVTNRLEMLPEIKAAISMGNVVCDRYWASAYAYGLADGLDPNWLFDIHKALPAPDLNILITIKPETSVIRRPNRRDRYELLGNGFFGDVQDNYLTLWGDEVPERGLPGGWEVVSGEGTVEEVSERIWEVVNMYRPTEVTRIPVVDHSGETSVHDSITAEYVTPPDGVNLSGQMEFKF